MLALRSDPPLAVPTSSDVSGFKALSTPSRAARSPNVIIRCSAAKMSSIGQRYAKAHLDGPVGERLARVSPQAVGVLSQVPLELGSQAVAEVRARDTPRD